jgi:transcriptional regulator GlxA family with amidase domain
MELLNCLSQDPDIPELELSVISERMDPVTPAFGSKASHGYAFQDKQVFLPTHTFENAPRLDVLIVPGGAGTRASDTEIEKYYKFIRIQYCGEGGEPPLKYIFSVCNGSRLLAGAGILDGQKATTNKKQWLQVTSLTCNTHWLAKARWVVSGNIWTCSGVSAGVDGMAAFIEEVYGEDAAARACDEAEYTRHLEEDDPFAEKYGCADVLGHFDRVNIVREQAVKQV